jgi:hypothetical protein
MKSFLQIMLISDVFKMTSIQKGTMANNVIIQERILS